MEGVSGENEPAAGGITPPRQPLHPPATRDAGAIAVAAQVQALHQRRDRAFPTLAFANPEWNVLLELFVQTARGRETCVTSLCLASGVPVSSALRCINGMIREGILSKSKDEDDRRRFLITMNDRVMSDMQTLLSSL